MALCEGHAAPATFLNWPVAIRTSDESSGERD
jgi:hypothetical protein